MANDDSDNIKKLAKDTAVLAKNKVVIAIDDNHDHGESVAMLLGIFGIDTRPITSAARLPGMVEAVNKEGKEVFLILSDRNLGNGMTGEQLWKDIQNGEIKGLNSNTIFEVHSGATTDDPANRNFAKGSSQSTGKPLLERINRYLHMPRDGQNTEIVSVPTLITEADKESYDRQLEFARLAASCPYDEHRRREGTIATIDYYEGNETSYLKHLKDRTEWRGKFQDLAKKATDYGHQVDLDGKTPSKPIGR